MSEKMGYEHIFVTAQPKSYRSPKSTLNESFHSRTKKIFLLVSFCIFFKTSPACFPSICSSNCFINLHSNAIAIALAIKISTVDLFSLYYPPSSYRSIVRSLKLEHSLFSTLQSTHPCKTQTHIKNTKCLEETVKRKNLYHRP